jgi:hypothetical protein
MLTENSEIQLFHQFLGERLEQFSRGVTPEEAVEEFRSYQAELERCRREVEPALRRSQRAKAVHLIWSRLRLASFSDSPKRESSINSARLDRCPGGARWP